MTKEQKEKDNSTLLPLAQKLLWLSAPETPLRIVWGIVWLGGGLVLLEAIVWLFGGTHGDGLDFPGWQAVYGFIMCVALVLSAKVLRLLVGRKEDYYGEKGADAKAKEDIL